MSSGEVNKARRRLLIGATSAMGAVGAVGVAVPFVRSWTPSEKAKAAGAPAKADVSKIEPGAMLTVEWRGKPVYVVRRTSEAVKALAGFADKLKDPNSDLAPEQQPSYAVNTNRSRTDEYVVLEGVCTHLGCAPKFFPEVKPEPFDSEWQGGFFCPCHGSKFDLAGRVFSGSPAGKNLKVPPHSFEGDGTLVIGIDEENA